MCFFNIHVESPAINIVMPAASCTTKLGYMQSPTTCNCSIESQTTERPGNTSFSRNCAPNKIKTPRPKIMSNYEKTKFNETTEKESIALATALNIPS